LEKENEEKAVENEDTETEKVETITEEKNENEECPPSEEKIIVDKPPTPVEVVKEAEPHQSPPPSPILETSLDEPEKVTASLIHNSQLILKEETLPLEPTPPPLLPSSTFSNPSETKDNTKRYSLPTFYPPDPPPSLPPLNISTTPPNCSFSPTVSPLPNFSPSTLPPLDENNSFNSSTLSSYFLNRPSQRPSRTMSTPTLIDTTQTNQNQLFQQQQQQSYFPISFTINPPTPPHNMPQQEHRYQYRYPQTTAPHPNTNHFNPIIPSSSLSTTTTTTNETIESSSESVITTSNSKVRCFLTPTLFCYFSKFS
jgi:hypothetical protein